MRKVVALSALAVGAVVAVVFILFFNTGGVRGGSLSYEANYTVSGYAVYGKDKIPLSGWMIVGVKGDEGYAVYRFEVEYLFLKFRLTGAEVVKDGIYYKISCMNDECQVEKTRVDELPVHPITRQILKKEVPGFKATVKELGDCEYAGRKGKLYEREVEIEGRYAELLYGEKGPIYENSLMCLADFELYEKTVVKSASGELSEMRVEAYINSSGPYSQERLNTILWEIKSREK
ncbi:hypothetical protein [Pyrobaculum neutrophilum]|nr:hypothetical protein [Pyrobaculum neutrophilum]